MDVDDVDRRILAALLANGRATREELGALADVEPTAAGWRRERLESLDVIDGYEPRLDYEALGYSLTAVVWADVGEGPRGGAASALGEVPQFHTVYEVTGPTAAMGIGVFRDRADLNETLEALRLDDRIGSVRVERADPVSEWRWPLDA
jgi:Lrp/AsnC family leucine-responsive transcriptional regulator